MWRQASRRQSFPQGFSKNSKTQEVAQSSNNDTKEASFSFVTSSSRAAAARLSRDWTKEWRKDGDQLKNNKHYKVLVSIIVWSFFIHTIWFSSGWKKFTIILLNVEAYSFSFIFNSKQRETQCEIGRLEKEMENFMALKKRTIFCAFDIQVASVLNCKLFSIFFGDLFRNGLPNRE